MHDLQTSLAFHDIAKQGTSQAVGANQGEFSGCEVPAAMFLKRDPLHQRQQQRRPKRNHPALLLVIHGRFIYPLPASGSGEPFSDPLYQLSRAIHSVSTATEDITIERLEYRRDLYRMSHRAELPFMGLPFEAKLLPQSNKTLGKISIVKSPLFRHGYRALKVLPEEEQLRRQKKGLKWMDKEGTTVAKEERVGWKGKSEEGDEYRLRVLVPLSRRTLDSLVALWCLWMWHVHIEESKPKKTWEDRKRIIQMPRSTYSIYGGGDIKT
ncbi:hypothetical protein N0V88_007112 [Collariella sp. IMI 366227]|nr:hypothetical protein N0V88_007112 [Collariella sp. IMI 366227]